MDTLAKLNSLKIKGIVCISVSWCILFFAYMLALNATAVFRNYVYYVLYVVFFAAIITGCILLSFSSHKTILIKDQKETASSWFYLVVESLSIIVAALLTEIDLLYFLTSKYDEPLKQMASLTISSVIFMTGGIMGLSSRRAVHTPPLLFSIGLIGMAVVVLGITLK